MGIRFLCSACGKRIHVKDYQAGKRGFCPKCQARVDIPLESTIPPRSRKGGSDEPDEPEEIAAVETLPADVQPAAATAAQPASAPLGSTAAAAPVAAPPQPAAAGPAVATPAVAAAPTNLSPAAPDPIAEAPHLQWYVMPALGAPQYGPATGATLCQWINEGRVASESLVWRQDWPDWRRAGSVLPQLIPSMPPALVPAAGVAVPAAAVPTAAAHAGPAAGLPAGGTAALRAAPAAAVPALGAQGAWSAEVSRSPGGSSTAAADLYYARRSKTAHTVILSLLVAIVGILAYPVYLVITRSVAPSSPASQPAADAPTEG